MTPLLAVLATPWLAHGQSTGALRFDQYLDSLRQQAGIPGMSVAIVQDRALVWERGFGEADIERNIAATPDTPYPVGGLTASFSAVLTLACAEQALIGLDAPIGEFFPTFAQPDATLRHVLAHVSPTGQFVYDPSRYDAVAAAIKTCTGKTLRSAVADGLLDRLAMTRSVPGHDFSTWSPGTVAQFPPETVARYAAVMNDVARAYKANGRAKATPTTFVPATGLTGSSGLVATVRDVARFQAALDAGILLLPDTLRLAWTAPMLPDGRLSPHGLGWFVQTYQGQPVVWQFGLIPEAYSSLVMTLPQRGITLILLANSDGLVTPFPLANGDVTVSPFARLFLGLFF